MPRARGRAPRSGVSYSEEREGSFVAGVWGALPGGAGPHLYLWGRTLHIWAGCAHTWPSELHPERPASPCPWSRESLLHPPGWAHKHTGSWTGDAHLRGVRAGEGEVPPPAALKGAPRQNSLATRICWAGPPWLSEAWAGALVEEQGGGLCKSAGSPRNGLGYTGLGNSSLSSLETRTQLPHLSISIRVPGIGLSTLYACAHACLATAQRPSGGHHFNRGGS